MSTPDITKAISSNDIKNGASLLLVNKTGTEVLFDSSRDTEQGVDPLGSKTTDRFDDTGYYSPLGSSGTGNSFTLDNVTDNGAITTNGITVSSLMLSQGSKISETDNAISLAPPTAVSGQSLVIRPTAASEQSHVHLVAGNPSTVDIYLGDDDQYVKIEKDGGDVVIGTDSNTRNWTFGNDGKLTLPGGSAQVVVENDYGVRIGTAGTNVAPNSQIKIGGAEHAFEIFGGPPGYSWTFDGNGELTLPASGSITFPNNTTQTSAGIPSNTGLVPNSVSITNMVSISQANYDALVTKDSSTLYIISHPGGGSGPPPGAPSLPPPPPPGG